MAVYLTSEGDILDQICAAHYGRQDRVERVLAANPGLAGLGPVLPARVAIFLPVDESRTTGAVVRLWGRG